MGLLTGILGRFKPKNLPDAPSDIVAKVDLTPDGSLATSAAMESVFYDFDLLSTSEVDLIRQYRRISHIPEVATAIDEVVNEIVVIEEEKEVVSLLIDEDAKIADNVQKGIQEVFDYIIKDLLDFKNTAYDRARDWYVDSRLVFMKNLNPDKNSIASLTQLDPCKLRRIKIIAETPDHMLVIKDDYFVYLRNSQQITGDGEVMSTTMQLSSAQYADFKQEIAFKIPSKLITFVDSGLVNRTTNIIYGHLHKAVKSANQLDLVETSSVLHRLSRSTPQRAIYVDTGNLNPAKSKQVLEEVKRSLRNEESYDAARGTVNNKNRVMSLREDIFLSRHSGGKTTEITSVGPEGGFDQMDGVTYFKEKLYGSLNIPPSRFKDSTSIFAQNSEITREELKFARFVVRLRSRFSMLFYDLLKTQLLLTKVIKASEWTDIYNALKIRYNNDNHYSELKKMEIGSTRLAAAKDAEEFVGKYFSNDYIRRDILHQSTEDIEKLDKEIAEESTDPRYKPPPGQ